MFAVKINSDLCLFSGGKRIFTRKLAETASASMENLAANGNGTPRSRRHQKK